MAAWEAGEVLGLTAATLAYALACLVLAVSWRRPINRLLALLLFLEGNLQLIAVNDPRHPVLASVAEILITPSFGAIPFVYLLLLGSLQTPLVRWLRVGSVRLFLAATATALGFGLLPLAIAERWNPDILAPVSWLPIVLLLMLMATYLFAVPAGISSLRRAATPAARRQAAGFLASFGLRDACFLVYFAYAFGGEALIQNAPPPVHDSFLLMPVFGELLFVPLLVHGILRTQVLDLEIRLRRGVSGTFVAAAFLATFVLVTEGVQRLSSPRVAPFVGAVAAGMLVFVFAPLRRLADGWAKRMLPPPGETESVAKRLELYEAALEETSAATPLEDPVLSALRDRLGLTERDHAVLQHVLRARGARSAAPPHPWPTGLLVLQKYRVLRPIGDGHADCYCAWDEELRRSVAIKAIHGSKSVVESAHQEARAMARVRHPNVLTIYDAVMEPRQTLIIMEYAEGGSLQQRIAQATPEFAEAARLANELLDGLGAVHAAGLLHRDVKPSNVFLDAAGAAKLGDFGIAVPADATLSLGMAPMGTTRYMSPEQAQGRPLDHRSDLYSAALTIAALFQGRAATQGTAGSDAERRWLSAAGETDLSAVPPGLEPFFHRALQRDPDARFPSAQEMAGALRLASTPILAAAPTAASSAAASGASTGQPS